MLGALDCVDIFTSIRFVFVCWVFFVCPFVAWCICVVPVPARDRVRVPVLLLFSCYKLLLAVLRAECQCQRHCAIIVCVCGCGKTRRLDDTCLEKVLKKSREINAIGRVRMWLWEGAEAEAIKCLYIE